jgi:Fungal protein of unknown function (DUF1748).
MVWIVNYHTMTLLHIDAVLVANVLKYASVRKNSGVTPHTKTNKNNNLIIIFYIQNPLELRYISIYLDYLQGVP